MLTDHIPPPTGLPALARRPLMPISAVEFALDRVREEVMAEIEDGRLPWAWHLESHTAHRKCVRVLARCIPWRQAGRTFPDLTEAEALAEIVPALRRTFTVQELRRRLTVSAGLVRDLVRDGELDLAPGSPCRTGAGGSPQITRESIVRLLRARRIQ